MALTQAEADHLLHMRKRFVDNSALRLTQTLPMDIERELLSSDQRERFSLDIRRNPNVTARLRYQTRARVSIILARLEINGRRHQNPPTEADPAGAWISGTHLHIYKEGFGDKFAYDERDLQQFGFARPLELVATFKGFLRFCAVQGVPPVQLEV